MPTIKPQVYTVEDAEDSGVIGTILDPIENEAYTVQGQGAETAARERQAKRDLRAHAEDASVDDGSTSKAKKSSRSSSGSSSASSTSSS
jgi:hypothetical protein